MLSHELAAAMTTATSLQHCYVVVATNINSVPEHSLSPVKLNLLVIEGL